MPEGKKVIIHDLPFDISNDLFSNLLDEFIVIDANLKSASCVGCFECWLKVPGICKFSDRLEYVGESVLSSKKLIIISPILYGGVSIPIKKVLDRSIPGITPFFKKRFGKLHHKRRYDTYTHIQAYYYNTKNNSINEKSQAKEYIDALGINFYSNINEVFYINDMNFSEVKL